jgi:hypothetical protein
MNLRWTRECPGRRTEFARDQQLRFSQLHLDASTITTKKLPRGRNFGQGTMFLEHGRMKLQMLARRTARQE